MTPQQVKSAYRRALDDKVTLRRYTGAGSNRPRFDVENVRAQVIGYQPHELVGTVVQGDRKAILYADDLIGTGFSLPVTTNDKLVVRGRELAIVAADGDTRKIGSTLIAYELQVRG